MNRRSQPIQSIAASGSVSLQAAGKPAWHYETAVAEIETIVTQIESGELELAEVLDQFAIAVEQLKQCETFLAHHQQQIDLVIETLMDSEADEEF